jgi:hypothetical protein
MRIQCLSLCRGHANLHFSGFLAVLVEWWVLTDKWDWYNAWATCSLCLWSGKVSDENIIEMSVVLIQNLKIAHNFWRSNNTLLTLLQMLMRTLNWVGYTPIVARSLQVNDIKYVSQGSQLHEITSTWKLEQPLVRTMCLSEWRWSSLLDAHMGQTPQGLDVNSHNKQNANPFIIHDLWKLSVILRQWADSLIGMLNVIRTSWWQVQYIEPSCPKVNRA